jgi:monofunctional glycosyltransferase
MKVSGAKSGETGKRGFIGRLLLVWFPRLVLTLLVSLVVLAAAWRFFPPVSTLMAARYVSLRPVDRQWTALERMSPALQAAVIMSEDGQFCRHSGVDWPALTGVLNKGGDNAAPRGASTIPMQTAKNLFLWPQRSFLRKALEIPIALGLNLVWPKRRMLEVYLNIAEWGEGTFGAEAAAKHYFGKSASVLTSHEAALLASALPNPILRNPSKPTSRQRFIARIIERRIAESAPWLDCLK